MFHEPVLTQKVIEFLIHDRDGLYLDGTLGGGGHSAAILARLREQGRVIGLDLDDEALQYAQNRLSGFGTRFRAVKSNFKNLDQIRDELQSEKIAGLLLDLGVSSHQIDMPERGFSFSTEGGLDMRMNREQALSALQIVNHSEQQELRDIFRTYGEERRAGLVAKAIVAQREKAEISTTRELVDIVSRVTSRQHRIKSLARIFQALRIAVNQELDNLRTALEKSMDCLAGGGRIVVISYHSLEDRIVKKFFRQEASRCECPPELPVCVCNKLDHLRILTKRPVRASEDEILANPRSRSAKLRAAEIV